MKKIFLIASTAALLSACVVGSEPAVSQHHNAIQGKWGVVAINGKAVETNQANIGFSTKDQRFYGNGSCNIMNGRYTLNNNQLTIEQVATTRATCPEIDTETSLLQALQYVRSYQRQGDKLQLLDAQGNIIIESDSLSRASEENTVTP